MIGSIVGGLGGAIGSGIALATQGKGGRDELKEAVNLWRDLQLSNFDFSALSPPQLRLVAEYFPEEFSSVAPPDVQLAADSAVGRGAELQGLQYFQDVAQKGLPIETRLATEEAQRAAGEEARRSQEAILENLQARGRLGGGTEIAARLGGNQQAMELARGMGSDIARNEILARMDAAGRGAGLGSQIRAGDVNLSTTNADIANRFNQWVASQKQNAAQYNAGARERAQFANVGERQRVADTNTFGQYQTKLDNLNRQNALREAQFGQGLAKTQGLTSALGGLAQAKYEEQAARSAAIQSIGQGVGQAAGGVGDILGSAGYFGDTIKDMYRRPRY